MKQSKPLEIWVGVFEALGFAALFVLAMKVSNISTLNNEQGNRIKVLFENIGSLKVRSPVTVAGVRNGRVEDISFDDKLYEAVVTLKILDRYHLPSDTSASIFTACLLGEHYVGLEPGGAYTNLIDGDRITMSQSAVVLEQIIGQFLFKKAEEGTSK